MPEHDEIKHRLEELFSNMPSVPPNVAPKGIQERGPAAPQPAFRASLLPTILQAPFYHLALPFRHAQSPHQMATPGALPNPAFEQSFELQAAGMILTDLEGRLMRANPAFCQMLGFTRAELVGASFQPLIYAEDLKLVAQAMRAMLLGAARSAHIELRFQRKDGALAQIELHLALLPDAFRKPAYFSILALDVTGYHETAAELQRRIQELESRKVQQQDQPLAAPALPSSEPDWVTGHLTPDPQSAPSESEWQPDLSFAALETSSFAPEALVDQHTTAQPPILVASEWQPELPKPSLEIVSPQPDPSTGKPQWLSGEGNILGDEEFPEVVYLPSTQTRAVKAASLAPRRDLAMHEPAVEKVSQPTMPLAALALPRQSGAGIFARPWERLLLRLGHMAFAVYLLLYLVGIALAELVTTFASPQLGLVIHGGLLVLIFLHASIGADRDEQRFLLTLTLAPLIRLLSLSMPLLEFQFLYWYMLIGAPLFLSVWLIFRLTGYTPRQVGLSLGTGLPLQIAVALTGLVFGYLEYVILKPAPLVESFSLQNIWLPALILLVFTGFLEELIFRGLMQRASLATIRKLGPLYISLLFAVLHIGYRSLADFVFVFLVGFFFSLVAERTRSLLGVTLAHGLTNISLFLIFPFLSS